LQSLPPPGIIFECITPDKSESMVWYANVETAKYDKTEIYETIEYGIAMMKKKENY
jgi:hypothetical protein